MQGRYDLVVESDERRHASSTSRPATCDDATKAEEKRAKESLQLDVYALAHLDQGAPADRVELRFLETGLAGGKRPTPEEATRTEERHPGGRGADPPA